jgi:hypothetical protein
MIDESMLGNPIDENNLQYEFLRKLQDTCSLLGGKKELRDWLDKAMDNRLTLADVQALRNYNCDLIEGVKMRLAHLHTLKIKPVNRETEPGTDQS